MKNILLLLTLSISSLIFAQDISMQSGTFSQCTGVFYDSGGEFGPYSNDENLITTICSDVAGDFVQLDFTAFNVQLNADVMNIYDGDDTSAALIGSYTGPGGNPGAISASAANVSGCLTVEFISNGSGSSTGWVANINCFTPCQTITATIDSTDPAAVAGSIEVDPGEVINFVGSAVFSNDGTGATYTWDFGNGDTLDGENINYAYPNPGTYNVTLTVTDTNPLGCSGTSASIEVVVLDNDACVGALPICGDLTGIPSLVGSTSAESGIDYDCLGSQPNPRWYFLQSGPTAGSLNFTLTQSTTPGGAANNDVDFILWGPFDEPKCGPANLNSSTQIDCSYSGSATESINIPNATPNSFYVLLITNFSNDPGFFNLQLDASSTATTNCDIICQVDLGEDQELCDGQNYTIDPDFNGAFNTFEWRKDDVVIPGETGSTLTVTESGTYKLIADGLDAVFGDPCTTEDEVVIVITDTITLNDITLTECSATTTANFNLDNAVADILNPLNAADYTVSFHNNATDATNDASAITGTNSYNGTNGEILHVRVEATGTNCFSISTVTLTFSSQPTITSVGDLQTCDDGLNDGTELFNLESQTATILGTQSSADYTVTYYTSLADAAAGTGSLTSPYGNTSNPQSIYVRVEDNDNAACFNVTTNPSGEFSLIVDPRDDSSFTMTATCDGGTVDNV
ncbi:MAG: PKD domain-containing protein, partial [Winogradskyella sp.]